MREQHTVYKLTTLLPTGKASITLFGQLLLLSCVPCPQISFVDIETTVEEESDQNNKIQLWVMSRESKESNSSKLIAQS